jgi:hypothetical protein
VAKQLDRGADQQQPEQQEHEREGLQQRRPQDDEDHAQDEREDDADDEHLLRVLARHRERTHDDHEDEEVVDRQALLDDVPAKYCPPNSRPAIYYTAAALKAAGVEIANATFAARQAWIWGEGTTTVASDSSHFGS